MGNFCLFFLLISMVFPVLGQGGLKTGFYSSSCPNAESIGCDGSVLISGTSAERNAVTNTELRGFETGGPSWGVPTGRRDGRISSSSEALNLPSPLDTIDVQRKKFAAKGLDDHELVTLVGAHTIGQTDCRFFSYRLYNFTRTGNADPSIDQQFLAQLQTACPQNGDGLKKVALDKDSQMKFDVSFFKNVRNGNGILESDQRLLGDPSTKKILWRIMQGL
ncbi:hypothetical protein K7X08_017453 [Anisodus acutangulus]|uniref:peroxidase n=1 Tax=Anisodus acutangulus TaxID=402998 RepID=A0A9Q1LXQ8_9SOLA|nr:hypothetical protein K7X08_017453 [Anisodus acutangulus]